MFKTFPIVLDVTKHQLNDMFQVNSNDLNTVRLNLSIKSGLDIFDLTGKIVRIAIKKPDGFIAFQTGGVTDPSNGLCEFILDRQAYLVEGKHEAEVMIYQDDSTVIVTERFYYKVNRAIANDKSLISTNHLPAINQAIIAGEQLKDIDIPEFVEAANSAYETIEEAETQGLYAKGQGDYAKQEADRAAARVTELNGVDAVQFKDRQDQFDKKVDEQSYYVSLKTYGVKGDGVTDDADAIQNAINSAPVNSTVSGHPGKTYAISKTILLRAGVTLNLWNAVVKPTADIDLFSIPKDAKLTNVKVDVSSLTAFTKAVLSFKTDSGYSVISTTDVSNISMIGKSALGGTALLFDGSAASRVCAFVKVSNVNLYSFAYGIRLNGSGSGSWVNGNNFNNINMYKCGVFLDLSGEADGNVFNNIQIQPAIETTSIIRCEGKNNTFNITGWDYNLYYPALKPYVFTQNASYNKLTTNHNRQMVLKQTTGNNGSNSLNGVDSDAAVFIHPKERSQNTTTSTTQNLHENFIGQQDNVLTLADKNYTVSLTGPAPSTPINRVFTANPALYTSWTTLTPTDVVKITIDCTNEIIKYGHILGVLFAYKAIPDYLKIETEDSSGVITTHLDTNSISESLVYAVNQNSAMTTVKMIHITFSNSKSSTVRISNIFMSSGGNRQKTFIETEGGKMHGDLEYNTSAIGTIMKSPDGSRFRLTIGNDGAITTTKL